PRACDTRIGHDRQDCDEPFGEHSCPHHKSGKTAKLDALALKGTPIYTFGYDPTTNQLTTVTDSANNVTTVARKDGQVTITAPQGQVTTLALDANGYLASVTNPNGETTQLSHTNTGLLTSLVDARGGAHHFEYDADGRLTKDVDATPGSSGQRLSMSSDDNGWSVDVTSAADLVTRYRVDQNGDFGDTAIVERRTMSQGDISTITNTKSDGSKSAVRPDGTKITVLATAADPLWGVSAAYNQTVQLDVGYPDTTHTMTKTESRTATMATAGNPFTVTGETITTTASGAGVPNSVTTSVYAAGPPATWTTTSAAGRQVRQTLDSLERVTDLAVLGADPVALFPMQYHYDAKGRVDQVTQGTRVYTTNYDPATGWVESTSDPVGLGVSYTSRDLNGRPRVVNLPGGRSLALSYDANGNVATVTPPSKPVHGFSWDPADRMSTYSPPNLGFAPKDTTYGYDNDGLMLSMLQPSNAASYAYDGLGRLAEVGDTTNKVFAYDGQGRLASITTSDGVAMTNTYDGSLLSRQAVSGPFAHAINTSYDNFLRPTSWDIDGANPIALAYDGDGQITSTGGMSVTRGNNGLLKSTAVGTITDAFSYNGYGEVIGHTLAGAATGYAAIYTRDAAGRIDTKTETIGGVDYSEKYTYDGAGRLWQVFVNGAGTPYHEWTYDANGNRSDGTYDDQDRLISNNAAVFAYGPNGELSTKTDKASGAQTGYVYDAQGNLRSVTRPVPATPIDYVIDGLNRRIGKKVGGALAQGFLYDGSSITAELDAAGAEVSRFVYATGGNSPDLMIKGGVTYRFVKDHLGSPRLVVNAATGAVAQRMDFDEWGNVTADSNPGFQPFGFAGGLWDRDTGLVRFGARDYDASTGRWTSKDASRFDGGLNLYGYSGSDPVNYIDPRGHNPVIIAGAVIGGVLNLVSELNNPCRTTASLITAFATGAIVGAAGVLIPGLGAPFFAARMAANAAVGFAGNLFSQGATYAARGGRGDFGVRNAFAQASVQGMVSVGAAAIGNGVGLVRGLDKLRRGVDPGIIRKAADFESDSFTVGMGSSVNEYLPGDAGGAYPYGGDTSCPCQGSFHW
ncbi:MAG: hypothetical protein FWD73_15675, partial [Polyangiaceae bacterium]|nr:hypothetical protein [Polyangiaceae bacterium]